MRIQINHSFSANQTGDYRLVNDCVFYVAQYSDGDWSTPVFRRRAVVQSTSTSRNSSPCTAWRSRRLACTGSKLSSRRIWLSEVQGIYQRVCVRARLRACVRACAWRVCACVRVCVCVCVCARVRPVTRCAATWPLELELKCFLSNNVRISTATEMSYCAIIIETIAHIAATFTVVRTW